MKKFLIAVALLVMPAFTFADMASDSVKSVKKVGAIGVELGYSQFSSILWDAESDLEGFLPVAKSKKDRSIAEELSSAIDCYGWVKKLWGYKISSNQSVTPLWTYTLFFEKFPDANKPVSEGGIIYDGPIIGDQNAKAVRIDDAVQFLLGKANGHVAKADALIRRH